MGSDESREARAQILIIRNVNYSRELYAMPTHRGVENKALIKIDESETVTAVAKATTRTSRPQCLGEADVTGRS
jgi:hypothetical protein